MKDDDETTDQADRRGSADAPKMLADLGWGLHLIDLIVRSLAGFVLGALCWAVPFMGVDTGKPWYFWFISGILAFALGFVMIWLSHLLHN